MSKLISKRRALLLLSLSSIATSHATAQTVDYGSLQELFGEPVSTSATGKPQRASEAPVPMEIVSAEDIERTGATNIPDAIRHVMGVDYRRHTSGQADIGIRGNNAPYNSTLLVLVNGRQVYADHFGMTFWDTIPVQMAEIRQIEIVRGPNTALFGFNAAAGVINIVTFDPQYDTVNDVRVTYGTQEFKEASAVVTAKLGEKGGITLSGSAREVDPFKPENGLHPVFPLPRVSNDRNVANMRMSYQLTDNTIGQLEANFANSEGQTVPLTYLGGQHEVDFWSVRGTVTSDTGLGLIKANVYYNDLEQDLQVQAVASELRFKNKIWVAQLEDLFKIGTDHSFRVFGEYRNNKYESRPSLSPFADNREMEADSFALAGMWDWAMAPWANLVVSGRYDHLSYERRGFEVTAATGLTNEDFDRSVEDYSYNASLVFKLTDNDRVAFSTARGLKMPALGSLAGVNESPLPFGTLLLGGEFADFDSTIFTQYNASWTHDLTAIDSQFELNVFHLKQKRINSWSSRVPSTIVPPLFIAQDAEIGNSEEWGIEAKLAGNIEGFRYEVNYAYTDVDDDQLRNNLIDPNGDGVADAAQFYYSPEETTPEHRVNATLGRDFGRLSVDLFASYTSSFRDFDARGLEPFVPLSSVGELFNLTANASYKITDNIKLGVRVDSVVDQEYRYNAIEPIERRALVTLSAGW